MGYQYGNWNSDRVFEYNNIIYKKILFTNFQTKV